jgi:hypothetical protein
MALPRRRLLASTVDFQNPSERLTRLQQVGDHVAIERGEESVRRLAQRALRSRQHSSMRQ